MNSNFITLALAISLLSLASTALGISVSLSSESGGNAVSSSAVYSLDRSTSLSEADTLADGRISREIEARGSGDNSISILASASNRSTMSNMESSGEFQTSAFAGISEDSASIIQRTAMVGSYGNIDYYADSPQNRMIISSGFEGQGDLSAKVSVAAGSSAAITGNVNALGLEMLDSESMQTIASGNIAMSIDGLSNDGQGSFGLSAANAEKGALSGNDAAPLIGPDYSDDGGRAEAYKLFGFRWNTRDPQIKWILKNDENMYCEGLDAWDMKREVEAAANTWDNATNQNLFADNDMVTFNPNAVAEKYNKMNTISWKSFGQKVCLAYARTYYSLGSANKVDGYNSVLDSDLVFNTEYGWCANDSNTGVDVQSVALHEMGHSLGLGDLYGKPEFQHDTRQVMHYYTGVKRTLGNGDKTAIWNLYG